MRSATIKGLFLAMAIMVALPMSAAAQGTLGAGVSFLTGHGGTGFNVDYSAPIQTVGGDKTLSWVGAFSYHRNSDDDFGVDFSHSTMFIQGGVRVSGAINENVTWFAQGLIGINRTSFDSEIGFDDDFCDIFDIDCDFEVEGSSTGVVFSPGGGIDYAFNEKTSFRAQINIPVGGGFGGFNGGGPAVYGGGNPQVILGVAIKTGAQ